MFETGTTLGARAGEPIIELPHYDVWDQGFDDLVWRLTEDALARSWESEQLPDLSDLPPIVVAAFLHRIDPDRLPVRDQVLVLQARERLVAHHQAGSVDAIDAISRWTPPWEQDTPGSAFNTRWEFASDEIRAALCLTRHGAEQRVDLAISLADEYPGLLEMLREGRVDLYRVRVVVEGVRHLGSEERAALVESILSHIPELTSGELRALVRKRCAEIDSEQARLRYEHAVEDRRMWMRQTDAGTVDVHIFDMPIDRARTIGRRLNGYAISLKNSGDLRTMDQLRVDVLCDLIEGHGEARSSGRDTVELRVDLATLAGLDDLAGEIPGIGPIAADIARRMAERNTDGQWRFTVVDDDGNVIDTGITRRRFSPAQRRLLEARYTTCGFPGCRMPATECDIDHTDPFSEGGLTSVDNGTPECRHDHTLIHRGGWRHRVVDGRHHWISPLGHRYVKGRPP